MRLPCHWAFDVEVMESGERGLKLFRLPVCGGLGGAQATATVLSHVQHEANL